MHFKHLFSSKRRCFESVCSLRNVIVIISTFAGVWLPAVAQNLIADGTYTITNKFSNLVIDDYGNSSAAGNYMDQWAANGGKNQQWTLTNLGNNYVELTNGLSGLALEVYYGSVNNNAKIDQNGYGGYADQIWQVVSKGSGYYELINKNSGLAIEDYAYSTTQGTDLDQYSVLGGDNELWSFAPVTSAFNGPFKWSSSGPLISATSSMKAVKDPSAVYYDNQWNVYASSVDDSGNYNMEYLHFPNWASASSAQPYYLSSTPGLSGYHTAPQVFYFAPQNKWYLIYQSGQPQFSTNSDLTKPQNWTAPQNLLTEPSGSTWLDYWVICDSANCYLFFTGDNGKFYRSSTTIGNFPYGFSSPVTVLSAANNADLFEADNVYKLQNMNLYLAIIECTGPSYQRYFRAWTAPSLNGTWTPVSNASSWATPFIGENNVTFASGVTPWTVDFSSGGLLPGYDQTEQIDPNNMQFLFQGDNTAKYPAGTAYGQIPWQLGLATQTH